MILIADSGSTKTDWVFLDGEGRNNFETIGLNPFFVDEATVVKTLSGQVSDANKVEAVHFYGAGCSTENKRSIISEGLKQVFPQAQHTVEHDLLGAARATCLNEAGIACILGTGSSSCLFDGEKITHQVPALGYVLGDEGSGSHMGKLLLRK